MTSHDPLGYDRGRGGHNRGELGSIIRITIRLCVIGNDFGGYQQHDYDYDRGRGRGRGSHGGGRGYGAAASGRSYEDFKEPSPGMI